MALDEGGDVAGGRAGGADAGVGALFGGAVPNGGASGAGAEQDGGEQGVSSGAEVGDADPDWWGALSADAEGERASLLDWVKASGVKDLNGLAKIARDNQAALRDSGRIRIPGEGATPEEVAAFRAATGVPESVEGYALPQLAGADGEPISLDQGILGKLLPRALEHGVPTAAMNGLMNDFVQMQLDEQATFDRQATEAASAWVSQQGASGHAKLSAVTTAANALGLSGDELVAMRNSLASVHGPEKGVAKMLDMFSRLGDGMAEDKMLNGGSGRFSVSGREAQGEIDQMVAKAGKDRDFARAVQSPGTPENQRWNRLQEQAAAWKKQQDSA